MDQGDLWRDQRSGKAVGELKGPKREIFGLGIFAQIRPIWIGDLGTRPKNPKKLGLGALDLPLFPEILVLVL